jgi:hypothetical protein
MKILADNPANQPFVDCLHAGVERLFANEGLLILLEPRVISQSHPDNIAKMYIGISVERQWLFINLGIYIGARARDDQAVHAALHRIGRPMIVDLPDGRHVGLWENLYGHIEGEHDQT